MAVNPLVPQASKPLSMQEDWARKHAKKGDVVMVEILQKEDNPVATLKQNKGRRMVIVVPYEYGWDAKWQPFTNKTHKRTYDVESLSRDLEEEGLTFKMEMLEWGGWSFIGVECQ